MKEWICRELSTSTGNSENGVLHIVKELIRCKDCALWDDADSEHLVGYCTEGDGRLPSNGEKITFRNEWCCWAERKEE